MEAFRQVWDRRQLVLNLIARNLKIRYKSSVLGFFWTFLNPLFMSLIYLVFIGILRWKIDIRVLLTGIMPWQFFVMCVSDSVNTITGNTNLVKKTYFPRFILPLAMVLANLVNFLLSLVILFVLLLVFKTQFTFSLAFLPLVVIAQGLFILGIVLLTSCANVYFRDTEHIISVVLQAWFFLTPILYPLDMVPDKFLRIYMLNPLASLITAYRHVFLGAELPDVSLFFLSGAILLFLLAAGIFVFFKFEPYFADEL